MSSTNYFKLIRNIIREQLASLKNPLDTNDQEVKNTKKQSDNTDVSDKISDIEKSEKEELETIQSDLEMRKKERGMKTSKDPSVNAERDKRLKMDIDLLTKRAATAKKNIEDLRSIKNDSSTL